jgi:hypothetical protein
MRAAAALVEALVGAVPYRIHTALTDNGIPCADLPKNRGGPTARWRGHPFDRPCHLHRIEHRLTKPNHPCFWNNRTKFLEQPDERAGRAHEPHRQGRNRQRTATVKRYFHDTHNPFKAHLNDFLRAHPFARRLKTLKGLTPYEYLCKLRTQTPDRFTLNPTHQMPGRNS